MRGGRFHLLVAAAPLVAALASAAEQDAPEVIAIVVGIHSTVGDVTPDVLREVYLRRRRVWSDGSRVIAVNLPADSPVRRAFSKRVLGRLPGDLGSYWNRRYFEGIQPPLVLRSAGAVCAYLAVEPGAIGYVPADQVDDASCRVLLLLREGPP